ARQHSHHPVAFVSPPRISWGVSENRRDRSDRSSAGGPGGVKFLMGKRRGPLEARNVAGLFVQDCIMYRAEPLRLSTLSATSAKSSDPSASLLVVYTSARSRSQLRSTGANSDARENVGA
ncbi:hypothetical protein GOC09_30090, partial [Sinorhizobium meliloti]|nr:hypothetical protein [Sinorhizobium meliloti]MDW9837906.1 hypothetical protein [Sinorhizobium meliloti]MDX0042142.1 hypothetical protein [Sinorhizobium meliloti]MDX0091389.1 hypothetical protein [Sinorhizobium meliloti]